MSVRLRCLGSNCREGSPSQTRQTAGQTEPIYTLGAPIIRIIYSVPRGGGMSVSGLTGVCVSVCVCVCVGGVCVCVCAGAVCECGVRVCGGGVVRCVSVCSVVMDCVCVCVCVCVCW